MRNLRRPWPIVALSAVVVAALLVVWWTRDRTLDRRQMLAYLPTDVSTTFFVDLDLLRRADQLSLLTGRATPTDQEYRDFVKATGFDYARDLDHVAGAVRFAERFYVAQGRFDWTKLRAYAQSQKGKCDAAGCSLEQLSAVEGTPTRTVLFRELRPGLLGFVITDKPLIWPLRFGELPPTADVAADPLWVRTTGQEAAGSPLWPRALGGAIAESLGRARTVFFRAGLGPTGPRLRVEARYAATDKAVQAEALLGRVFDLLKKDGRIAKDDSPLLKSLRAAVVHRADTELVAEFPLFF